ncbi:glycine cleavage system protein GcvH [Candidatus Marithrix sp. Canyon 246]|uniref:glycine cleavage system protein GcvH n=1 Tax=Candidatus Marithrix sp. Canyon 246 TaxID=1827136 RepID=UPI00084A2C65|nr:glycine cleavage system protein GcvH [Candidatus Marithrix sp. Canyon 246]
MNNIPQELKYTKTHEWVRVEDDDTVTVGITDHAQERLGDIVFIELPELNNQVTAGTEVVVIESVKAAGDVYSPLSGEIIAINQSLNDSPELANSSPYEEAWLFKIKSSEVLDNLMNAEQYAIHTSHEE